MNIKSALFLFSILFYIGGIISFFLPWTQFEFVPVYGPQILNLSHEYFEKGSIMVPLSYSIYTVPVLSIWFIWSLVFGRKIRYFMVYTCFQLIVNMIFVAILYSFDQDTEINLKIREGGYMSLLAIVTGAMHYHYYFKFKGTSPVLKPES